MRLRTQASLLMGTGRRCNPFAAAHSSAFAAAHSSAFAAASGFVYKSYFAMGGGGLGGWVFSRVGGSKALDPPPLL